jgi:hypothetical protein
MTHVVVNADLKRMLHDLTVELELRDENGRVLAHVKPVTDLSQYEPLTPDISDEEIERRLNSNERRYSTREVIEHLNNL